jgi:hypothetical protein
VSGTAISWEPRKATAALARLRTLRRQRRRALRRQISLSDRLFPLYLTALFGSYAALVLSGTRDVRVNGTRIAATEVGRAAIDSLGCLSWLVALAVFAAMAAGAVDGGPITMPPEDLRILLTAPIPRPAVLRRALATAYVKAVLIALAATGLILLVEVALLSQAIRKCVLAGSVLPVCVAVISVSGGWLIECSRRGRTIGRVVGAAATGLLLAVAAWTAAAIGPQGQVAAWGRLHRLGDKPVIRALSDSAQPGTSYSRTLPTLVALVVIAVGLTIWAWRRTRTVSAEQLAERSGRSVAIRTALLVGMTSSAYVARTALSRRRHKTRWTPKHPRTPFGAVLIKAFLQEQGVPLIARIALAATTTTLIEAVLLARPHAHTATPALAIGVGAGALFAAAATRFADPLRIDIEQNTPSSSLPVSFRRIATADLGAPAITFTAGAVLAAFIVPALNLLPWSQLPGLLFTAVVLGPTAAVTSALSAASNMPWIVASSGASFALRARGLIASIAFFSLFAVTTNPPTGARSNATALAEALPLLLAIALALFQLATLTSGKALLRNR